MNNCFLSFPLTNMTHRWWTRPPNQIKEKGRNQDCFINVNKDEEQSGSRTNLELSEMSKVIVYIAARFLTPRQHTARSCVWRMEFSIFCSQSFLDLNVVAVENVIVMKLDTEFKFSVWLIRYQVISSMDFEI